MSVQMNSDIKSIDLHFANGVVNQNKRLHAIAEELTHHLGTVLTVLLTRFGWKLFVVY